MTKRIRNAFTLIELLVVMAIIAMLIGLLMTAVQSTRAGARKLTCQSNLDQVASALNLYNDDFEHYPGRTNTLAGNTTSWVVPITPYLARRARIFDQWRNGNLVEELIPILVCPSDTGDRDDTVGLLSYVVNCGMSDALTPPTDTKFVYNGIFYDVAKGSDGIDNDANSQIDEPGEADPTVSIDFLLNHDGPAYTLILTENIQAGRWTDTSVELIGFVWYLDVDLNTDIHPLNEDKLFEGAADLDHARPSCYHSSGANFAFADGHVKFFNDSLNYEVYRQLMTPNGADSDASADEILDEAIFK